MMQPVATYSIVACDPRAREVGVAVQSHYFSVGSVAPSAVAGVGAAVIQSIPKLEYGYGTVGLKLLRDGVRPADAISRLTRDDAHRDYRQVALVDCRGEVAAYTGRKCVASAGHVTGGTFSCQANMVAGERVWQAMAETFRSGEGGLASRLLAALESAEAAGGDVRGRQSASLTVVSYDASDNPRRSRPVDLRVEDDPEPLAELARLLELQRAYQLNARGISALARGDDAEALAAFARAEELVSDRYQLKFWRAVALRRAGLDAEAMRLFDEVFAAEPHWRSLLPALREAELLP